MPNTGTRPSRPADDGRLGLERLRITRPVREHHAVEAGELVGVDVVREHGHRRARAGQRRRIERFVP